MASTLLSPDSKARREGKGNRFLQTVYRITQKMGYDARYIATIFQDHAYASTDFILGFGSAPSTVPQGVWQSVHDHYNLCLQRPFYPQIIDKEPLIFKEKSDVFIANAVTERLINDQLLLEQFTTTKRLYQYLNWTMRMCKVAHLWTQMEGRNGGKVLLFDVELHDNRRGDGLYALCIPNDVVTHKSQRWQLAGLLTAEQLQYSLGIKHRDLPRGVRAVSDHFGNYREDRGNLRNLRAKLRAAESRRKVPRYGHLKSVQTGICKKSRKAPLRELTVKSSVFRAALRRALRSYEVSLIPIVSVVSRKRKNQKEKFEDFRFNVLFAAFFVLFAALCASCNLLFHWIALCPLTQCRLSAAGSDRNQLDRCCIPPQSMCYGAVGWI